MAFTTKEVRPVFERNFGATRRFVVKGNLAFAVLEAGEPVFGFVGPAALPRVESCVSLNSHSVPLDVVPPQWFAKVVSERISGMSTEVQRNYWTTLVAASKALGGNSGHIQLGEQHPFAQHARAVSLTVLGNRVEAADRHGGRVGVYTKPGIMHALTSQPGPIISWS
jgi:hypothetical protein